MKRELNELLVQLGCPFHDQLQTGGDEPNDQVLEQVSEWLCDRLNPAETKYVLALMPLDISVFSSLSIGYQEALIGR